MIVKNTKKGFITIPLVIKGKVSKIITLKEGYNEISDEIWKELEKQIQEHISSKKIIPVCGKKEEKEIKTKKGVKRITTHETIPFENLERDEALKCIDKCYDIKLLGKWLKKTKDEEIRLALKNQIDKINEVTKERNK